MIKRRWLNCKFNSTLQFSQLDKNYKHYENPSKKVCIRTSFFKIHTSTPHQLQCLNSPKTMVQQQQQL